MEKSLFFDRGSKKLNLDISYRCPLECLRCGRQTHFRNHGLSVPGRDLTLDEFDKITTYFKRIAFCGQYSDPIHHPRFIEFLEMCKEKNINTEVSVASSLKPKNFYINAFNAYPNAKWIFGIDGLPEESHIYRVNQDGVKLFDIMTESTRFLAKKPIWQYIVFKYNQDHIDEALERAKSIGVEFLLINSKRWLSESGDPLKPTIRRLS
jgi:MoaA/NifB/PqqE/SkfB family radical SAM enzyme